MDTPRPALQRAALGTILAAVTAAVVVPPLLAGAVTGASDEADRYLGRPVIERREVSPARDFGLGMSRAVGSYAGSQFTKHVLIPVAEGWLAPTLTSLVTDDAAGASSSGDPVGREMSVDKAEASDLAKRIAFNRVLDFVGLGAREFHAPFLMEQIIPDKPDCICGYRTSALSVSPDGQMSAILLGLNNVHRGRMQGYYHHPTGTLRLRLTLQYQDDAKRPHDLTRDAVVGPQRVAEAMIVAMQAAP